MEVLVGERAAWTGELATVFEYAADVGDGELEDLIDER